MMAEGANVSQHALKMKGYIDHLERLGFLVSTELATDLILNSLPSSYDLFLLKYNMNNLEKSISELHGMLKTVEKSLGSKPKQVLMIKEGGVQKKRHAKGMRKAVMITAKPAKIPKDEVCFQCGGTGH